MKLKRSKKGEFVPVIKNNKIYYGGYQNDLKEVGVSKFYRDRSCVVIPLRLVGSEMCIRDSTNIGFFKL